MLGQLAVLAERFQQNIRVTSIDWNKNLLSSLALLHQISYKDLGALVIAADFRAFDRNNDENSYLSGLGVRWKIPSENARACAIVDSDMGEPISNLAKVWNAWTLKSCWADFATAIAWKARLWIHDGFAHWASPSKSLSFRRFLWTRGFGRWLCQLPSAIDSKARHPILICTSKGLLVSSERRVRSVESRHGLQLRWTRSSFDACTGPWGISQLFSMLLEQGVEPKVGRILSVLINKANSSDSIWWGSCCDDFYSAFG